MNREKSIARKMRFDSKRIKRGVLTLVIAGMTVVPASADTYTINRDKLPETAQEMLNEHFPKAKVSMIKVDRHLLKKTDYDVKLVNGTKIEFNNSGKWTSVDCKKKEVPESLLPGVVKRYVKKNHPEEKVVAISKSALYYTLRLSDGQELKINLLGQLKSPSDPDDEEEETEE